MNKSNLLGIALILVACLLTWAAVAAEEFKPIGSAAYVNSGLTPHVMHELPVSENEVDAFTLMGIGCMHEINADSSFVDGKEVIHDATVVGTECIPFMEAPLMPLIMDSVPSHLVKKDGVILGHEAVDNPAAICNLQGYIYTAFLPVVEGEDIVAIEERIVGILITQKACSELVPI